jgi:hypothetical protein
MTTRGEVRAAHVVVATHYPIFDRGLFFTRLSPERYNCVAGPMDAAAAPKNAYWSADTMVRRTQRRRQAIRARLRNAHARTSGLRI